MGLAGSTATVELTGRPVVPAVGRSVLACGEPVGAAVPDGGRLGCCMVTVVGEAAGRRGAARSAERVAARGDVRSAGASVRAASGALVAERAGGWSAGRTVVPGKLKFCSSRGPIASPAGGLVAGAGAGALVVAA
jgi:hypothetical protein